MENAASLLAQLLARAPASFTDETGAVPNAPDALETLLSGIDSREQWMGLLRQCLHEIQFRSQAQLAASEISEESAVGLALAASDARRFEALFQGMPEACLLTDFDGKIQRANATAITLLGLPLPDGAAVAFPGFIAPEHRAAFLNVLDRFQSSRRAELVSFLLQPAKGTARHAELSFSLFACPDEPPRILLVILDRSSFQQKEDALRETQASRASIIDSAMDAIITTDEAMNIQIFNRAAELMFGYAASDVVGTSLLRLIPERFRAAHPGYMAQFTSQPVNVARQMGQTRLSEIFGLRADGSEFPLEASISHTSHRGRRVFMVVLRDVTEHTISLLALKRANERFNLAADAAGIGVWEYDLVNESLLWDERMYHMYRLAPRVPGAVATLAMWRKRIHPDDLARAHAELMDALRGDKPFNLIFRIVWPDGDVRFIRALAQVIRDASGIAIRVAGINIDITQRKRDEIELKRLALVATKSTTGIVITDARGLTEWVNPAFERLTGYELAQFAGHSPGALLQGRLTDQATVTYMRDCLAQGKGFSVDIVNYHRSGDHYWVHIDVDPVFDEEGRLTHFISVETDITEKKRVEVQLRALNDDLEAKVAERTLAMEQARNEAVEASQAKSRFLAQMSHEIRTPLNGVIGMVQLAQAITADPRLRDYLDKISRSGYHLLGVVSEILDYSKIEAGMLELDPIEISLREVLHNDVDMLDERAKAKGLSLLLVCDAALPQFVMLDPLRLSQVMINLISNAIKYSEHGEIQVMASLLSLRDQRVRIRFEVADQGVGMSPEFMAQLFQPFRQGHPEIARHYGGTGLGLTISRQLVKMMGGQLQVRSVEGQGSTFHFDLDLDLAVPPARPRLPESFNAESLRGRRVLVVEDNPFNQEIAREMLESVGVGVCVAEDGVVALRLLEDDLLPFDAVLMDIQMPNMDGYEATRRIRLNPAWRDLPIIAMTANATREDATRCQAVGMNDFLTKPVLAPTLYMTLGRWVVVADEEFTPVKPDGMVFAERPAKFDLRREPAPAPLAPVVSPVQPPAPPPPLYDLAVLEAMIGNDPAVLEKFIRRFLQTFREGLPMIESQFEQKDFAALSATGHRLKSTARSLGAKKLADVCQEMEALAREGSLLMVWDIADRLQAAFLEVEHAINKGYA